jgi:hypothetical protein
MARSIDASQARCKFRMIESPLPFALIGCSVTMHDPNRTDGKPTARIAPNFVIAP